MAQPSLYLLNTCPFCWKVRSLLEHIGLEHEKIPVNPMKAKKILAFTDGWKKVPVWRESEHEFVVDSTPIMKHIDSKFNAGRLQNTRDEARRDQWLEWADTKLSKATIPILYGGFFSSLKTTMRVSKLEKFGFFAKRIYAWAGFPIMWGIIARKRVKKDGRKPKQLWHDLLTEFTSEFKGEDFFGGSNPDIVDFAAFGYMRSVSPFSQFRQLEDHDLGMAWYRRMESTLKA